MHDAQHVVALRNGRHDHAHRILVIHLLDVLVLDEHLLVHAVDALDASLDLRIALETLAPEPVADELDDRTDEALALVLLDLHLLLDLGVGEGIEVMERQILQLLLELLDAETPCNRRIDVHRLQCRAALLVLRAVLQRAHIMQAVCQLDDDDADVLAHGEHDLADILRLLLLLIEDRDLGELCHAVHERRHIAPEALLHLLGSCVRVLHHIMEQCGTDGIRVHTEIQQNLRYRQRMDDVRLPGGAKLPLVRLCGKFIRRNDLAQIILLIHVQNFLDKHIYGYDSVLSHVKRPPLQVR